MRLYKNTSPMHLKCFDYYLAEISALPSQSIRSEKARKLDAKSIFASLKSAAVGDFFR